MCVRGIDIASVYDCSFEFWKCSDVVFFFYILLRNTIFFPVTFKYMIDNDMIELWMELSNILVFQELRSPYDWQMIELWMEVSLYPRNYTQQNLSFRSGFLSSSCIPYGASFSGLSILDCPSVFSNVYLERIIMFQILILTLFWGLYWHDWGFGLWCLTPLSTICQLYRGGQSYRFRKPGVPGENHRPVTSHWQSLSHNVVSITPHHEWGSNFSGDRQWLHR